MFSTVAYERKLGATDKYKKCYSELDYKEVASINKGLMEALIAFDKICRDNNLQYLLIAGALIGAVRNGKCIPWDDDIDLIMPKEDYRKIGEILRKDNHSDWSIVYPEENDVITLSAHFYNNKHKLSDYTDKNIGESAVFEAYLYLDIQVLENCCDNTFLNKIKGTLVNLIQVSYTSRRCFKKNDKLLALMSKDDIKLRMNLIMRKALALPTFFLSKKTIFNLLDKLLNNPDDSCEATIAFGAIRYFHEAMDRSIWYPVKDIELEGHMIMGPNEPELYLEHRYGDFRSIPSEDEKRERLRRVKGNWEEFL